MTYYNIFEYDLDFVNSNVESDAFLSDYPLKATRGPDKEQLWGQWQRRVSLICFTNAWVTLYLICTKNNKDFIKKSLIFSFVINSLEVTFYLIILLFIGIENTSKIYDIPKTLFLALKLVILFITDYRTVKIIDIIDTKNKNTK